MNRRRFLSMMVEEEGKKEKHSHLHTLVVSLVKELQDLGLPTDKTTEAEEKIHDFSSSVVLEMVGKHNHVSNGSFPHDQLAMGVKVEMEHTDDERIAIAISKDHLTEMKDYYTRLAKMEGGGTQPDKKDNEKTEKED